MAEPTTPTKYINLERMLSSPTLLLSSPGRTRNSFAHGIPDGAPIQGLTTPTKGNIQNIAPKETIAISPTKLFLSSSQMSTSSKFPEVVKAPVKVLPHHNGMKDTKQVQYIRLVTSQGVETAGRSVISAGPQYSNSKYQSVVATSQHPVTSYLNKPSVSKRIILPADSHNDSSSTVQNVMLPNTGNPLQLITTVSNMTGDGDSSQLYTLMSSPNLPQAQPARKEVYTPSSGQTHVHDSTTPTAISVPQSNLSITQQSFGQDIIKLRKPCNCTKSQCLKLYCDCFANGEFCSNCNCQNCFNNLDHEEERQKAVKQCLERNPQAFHPKIGKGSKADSRRHQKGCNCKRSGCLKNYCECYEAKIPCGVMCKCVGCKNYEENTEKKTFHVDMVENRRVPQALHTQKIPSQFMSQVHQTQTRLPHEYLKKNVIKAIMDCLITQCREAEVAKCKDGTTEKVVLEEFGRCLHDIISTCMKTQH